MYPLASTVKKWVSMFLRANKVGHFLDSRIAAS
jgi:hypothetical protein